MTYFIVGEYKGVKVYWRDCGNRASDISGWHPEKSWEQDGLSNYAFDTEDRDWAEQCLVRTHNDKISFVNLNGERVLTKPDNIRIEVDQ